MWGMCDGYFPHKLVFLGNFCFWINNFCFVLSKRFLELAKVCCFFALRLLFFSFLFSSFPFPFCSPLFLSSFSSFPTLSFPTLSFPSFFPSCCFFHFLSVKHSSWFKLNSTSKRQGFFNNHKEVQPWKLTFGSETWRFEVWFRYINLPVISGWFSGSMLRSTSFIWWIFIRFLPGSFWGYLFFPQASWGKRVFSPSWSPLHPAPLHPAPWVTFPAKRYQRRWSKVFHSLTSKGRSGQ